MQGYLRLETQKISTTRNNLPDTLHSPLHAGESAVRQELDSAVYYCFGCGARIAEGNNFCGICGQPRRSKEVMARISEAYQKQKEQNKLLKQQAEEGDPLAILEQEGIDEAIAAMTKEYYTGRKSKISMDGAVLLQIIYQPYVVSSTNIKRRSADGSRVRALGVTLNELEGWLGMAKAYDTFCKTDPVHQENLADIWMGIGEWAK